MKMQSRRFVRAIARSAVVAACLMAATGPGAAQSKPFGKGFDGWSFSQTREGKGVTNCRAFHRVGGRDDIAAMRTDGVPYLSVKAEGRSGRYEESLIDAAGITWTVTAQADGKRLWFSGLSPAAVEIIMESGGYDFYLGGTEDGDEVRFGRRGADAWARVEECVRVSRG
jgi:hypothetical protein